MGVNYAGPFGYSFFCFACPALYRNVLCRTDGFQIESDLKASSALKAQAPSLSAK
jgi:hypothetical protein